MNKFIKEQLLKCKIAHVPDFDEHTAQLLIQKNTNKVITSELHRGIEIDIEVEDYIIHPYPGFTLHNNWNRGIVPTDRQMHVLIIDEMGKMICVQAIGLNDNKAWGGWLPKKSCKII